MVKKELTSDEQLRLVVMDVLAANEHITLLHLRVGVLNAVAHLAGSAPTSALRELAEQLVTNVPGVRGVVNRIEAPGAPAPSRTIHLDLPSNSS
jgi:osmotically-inducible protein OsmY